MLADCFEALIAAIFIDQGFDTAYDFVLKHLFGDVLDQIITTQKYHASKSRLQEQMQSTHKKPPVYKILKEEGPEHDRTFTVAVYLDDKKLAEGCGRSKKEAEEQAAARALNDMV
jgi:ribonuclease-3